MSVATKHDENGGLMLAIWAGPDSPPADAFHSAAEWAAMLNESKAVLGGRVTAEGLHKVIAARNPAYEGFAIDPAIKGKTISDLDLDFIYARLNGTLPQG